MTEITFVETQTHTIEPPDISHIITEDDTPVDNMFSEKQMRLLTHTLYASWPGPGDGRPFLAMANVGLFFAIHAPPLVPDVLVSLDVTLPEEPHQKEHRSYFIWEYGKPPDVVVEVVSNRVGKELGNKLLDYARLGISYYVVYDPEGHISARPLRVFGRLPSGYAELNDFWLESVGLGVTLWEGEFETMRETWLRWVDRSGALVATGEERAAAEYARAESAEQRAESAEQRAQAAEQRTAMLAAKLRELGIDADG